MTREPRIGAQNQDGEVSRRLAIIRPVVLTEPRTPERTAAIAAVVAAGTPERTVRRWVADHEAEGIAGLAHRRPNTAGEKRVLVSREFDRAFLKAGHSRELLAEIGEDMVENVKGLWASRAEANGVHAIHRDVEFLLLEACEARGVELPRAAFRVSRRTVERFSYYRIVNQRRNDRKAYDDAKPRITRQWSHLAPMDVVVADVKPLDIIVLRPDGSEAWPRVIGFYDAGTGRCFIHVVLCNKGEGVRQEHVNEAFIAMVMAWGFPKQIYTDNGSELKGFEKIRPHLALVNLPGERTIIYAKPYNAAAKPVESYFARMDRHVTSVMEGYAGANRMVKKTQTVGRPPKPYPHGFEHFKETFLALIADFHDRPMGSGEFKGRSPNQVFADKVSAGWRPIKVDLLALDAAFCTFEERRVTKRGVSIGGVAYIHPQLNRVSGSVRVALPWRRGADPLFHSGSGWMGLTRDDPFPAEWRDGAREAARRGRSLDRAVASVAKAARKIDPAEARLRRQGRAGAPALAASVGALDLGAELRVLSAAGTQAAAAKAGEISEAERLRIVRDRTTERLLRSQARAG